MSVATQLADAHTLRGMMPRKALPSILSCHHFPLQLRASAPQKTSKPIQCLSTRRRKSDPLPATFPCLLLSSQGDLPPIDSHLVDGRARQKLTYPLHYRRGCREL